MEQILSRKIDKTQIRVFNSFEEAEQAEREFWMSCTPEERLTALEMMRRSTYGYDEGERGLQGFFEVVEREKR